MTRVRTLVIVMLLLVTLILTASPAAAAQKLVVSVNQSLVLTFSAVQRVAVANPEIADVVVVSGSEILLVGKTPGITTVHIWSDAGRGSYLVEVGANDAQIAGEIKNILGYSEIRVSKVNKNIILEGSVNDQYQRLRAEKVASAYGDKVINLLELNRPVQVKIEAQIIEINRTKTDKLGIRWGNDPTNPGTYGFGQGVVNSTMGGTTFGHLGGYSDVRGLLDALVKNGSARILSQPNVITLSGDKANIMVGGQIPVPVGLQNGSVTVEWKDYGIKLEISPEVNTEGLINSKIKAEVSTVDWTSEHQIGLNANFKIPPINIRKAETAIALSSGQTMAVGGLIASETTKDVFKLPLLADIPVLGKLFTSTSFSRGETELIILITPVIVNPQEYVPSTTKEMKDVIQENPWGGKENGGKN